METGLNTTFNISTNNEILTMKNIVKDYVMGEETSHVLKGIDLSVNEGEFLAILGPSGSGKSTLMNIIGCLDVPTSGEYILSGRTIADMDEKTLAHIRGREIGFIFQQFNLLPKQDALENVELPMIYAGVHETERRERATVLLEKVGLGDKLHHFLTRCPAVSSSVLQSPEQWLTLRRFFWQMNLPAHLTRTPDVRLWSSSMT